MPPRPSFLPSLLPVVHSSKNQNSFPPLFHPSVPSIQELEFRNKVVVIGMPNTVYWTEKKKKWYQTFTDLKSSVADWFDKNWLCQLDYTADISHKWMNYICGSKVLTTTKNIFKSIQSKAFSKQTNKQKILTNVC